jgi:hypothetical protein
MALTPNKGLRVISMVPSWTETLLACGVNVVGRTRFCIHPDSAHSIPAVGGTKDIIWDKANGLVPDLLLLDREENPKSMADDAVGETLATHITNIDDVVPALEAIALRLEKGSRPADGPAVSNLRALAHRWGRVINAPKIPLEKWTDLPGVQEWLKTPAGFPGVDNKSKLVYMIWKSPWMTITRETFIASVLVRLGIPAEMIWEDSGEGGAKVKYPEVDLAKLPAECLLLFSSEPFPFFRQKEKLKELPFPGALIDGECMSWFGIRSLIFLEDSLGLNS